jgi:hypothetical protein
MNPYDAYASRDSGYVFPSLFRHNEANNTYLRQLRILLEGITFIPEHDSTVHLPFTTFIFTMKWHSLTGFANNLKKLAHSKGETHGPVKSRRDDSCKGCFSQGL